LYLIITTFHLRSLNKQIKDKNEHKDKLTDDLKRDGERQHELEQQIQVFGFENENTLIFNIIFNLYFSKGIVC